MKCLLQWEGGKSGQELTLSIVYATAVGQDEVVSGTKLHPAVDTWFSFFPHVNLLEALDR